LWKNNINTLSKVGGKYEARNHGKWDDDELVSGTNYEEFTFVNKIYTCRKWSDPNDSNWANQNPIQTDTWK